MANRLGWRAGSIAFARVICGFASLTAALISPSAGAGGAAFVATAAAPSTMAKSAVTTVPEQSTPTTTLAADDWVRQFGTPGNEGVAAAAPVGGTNGGVYVVGGISSAFPGFTNAGASDFYIRQYAVDGSVVWTDQFGSAADESLSGVAVDPSSGSVYVAGYSGGEWVTTLRKYRSDHSVAWTKRISSGQMTIASRVVVEPSGQYLYIFGQTWGAFPGQTMVSTNGSADLWVRKYDANGNEVWTRQFGSPDTEYSMAMALLGDGGGIVVGAAAYAAITGQTYGGGEDAVLRKYGPDGSVQWTRQSGAVGNDRVTQLVSLPGSGDFYARLLINNYGNAVTRKYDANGNVLWEKPEAADGPLGADSTGLYVGGIDGATGTFMLRKMDLAGTQLWSRSVPGSGYALLQSLASDGTSLYVGGTIVQGQALATQTSSGGNDAYLYRLGTTPPITTLTVTSVDDVDNGAATNPSVCSPSHCSLREAITIANNASGVQTIRFNIPSAQASTSVAGKPFFSIRPTSPLPNITQPVVIDGTTQPGYTGAPLVEIDGSGDPSGGTGISVLGGGTTIKGLAINRFTTAQIWLASNGNNVLEANYVGTDVTGTVAPGNAYGDGVLVMSAGNRIGGTTPAARNVISGNAGSGVWVREGNDNVVQGNYVGTDPTGTKAVPNGIGIQASAPKATIGGTAAGAGNLISGNKYNGIELSGDQDVAQGNLIGTDVTGTLDLGNGARGVNVAWGSDILLGGTTPAARNVISGNDGEGIQLSNTPTARTRIQGNYIGVDVSGAKPLPNVQPGGARVRGIAVTFGPTDTIIGGREAGAGNVIGGHGIGIWLYQADRSVVQGNFIGTDAGATVDLGNIDNGILVDSNDTTIGGTETGAGNVIANQKARGVFVTSGTGNAILGNRIYNNGWFGIDLGTDGATPNDPGDADSGPNQLQNYPVVGFASTTSAGTTIRGSLNSTPNTTYRVELFSDPACGTSGRGQGSQLLGALEVTTDSAGDVRDASGNPLFVFTSPVQVPLGQIITATATSLAPAGVTGAHSTSEFSPCVTVSSPDTMPPSTQILSGPAGTVNVSAATFTFDAAGEPAAWFLCSLDGAAETACASPASYSGLADGAHSFSVRAVDPAGNASVSPATRTWQIDTTPPDTLIDAAPSGTTSASGATFAFSSTEPSSTFQCRLDDAAFGTCVSPVSFSTLSDGLHTFEVRATDSAGNTDATPAARQWTVDATPPDVAITAGPSGAVNTTTATFTFTSSDPTTAFSCSLDGAALSACTSPLATTVAEGQHSFSVQATDPVGNMSAPVTRIWTVDITAPVASITSGPSGAVNSADAAFAFTAGETSATFECALDSVSFSVCTSLQSYTAVAEGAHTFRVRATDAAGNVGSIASQGWTVDLTPPDTTITAGPAASSVTNATSVTLEFTATESGSTLECLLDGASFATCPSPLTLSGLANGPHTFQVRARDAAGNVDPTPASRTWTVDTVTPETTIVTGPSGTLTDTSATFTFSSDKTGATFACSLDGAAFTACTSPQTYTAQAVGSHTFSVRATDPAGNVDPTPASVTWTITAPAPTGVPAAPTNGNATNPTNTSIRFNWTDNANNETYYELTYYFYRFVASSGKSSDWIPGPTTTVKLGADVTSYTLTPVVTGAYYYFSIAACNAAGCSTTTTGSGNAVSASEAPTNVTVASKSDTAIQFQWHDNSAIETSYLVYWWYQSFNPTTGSWGGDIYDYSYATVPANSTSYTLTGLPAGTYYLYFDVLPCYTTGGLLACDWQVYGYTGVPYGALPATPLNVMASATTPELVQWSDVANESGYQAAYCTSSVCQFVLLGADTTSSTLPSGLASGTYYVYVRSWNAVGPSYWGGPAYVTVP